MRIKANNTKEEGKTSSEIESAVEQKLNEVNALLAGHDLDDETREHFQQKLNIVLHKRTEDVEAIAAFDVIDKKEDASREELLDEFSILLVSNKVDSRAAGKYLRAKRLNNLLLIIISLVMITFGLGMIVIPAPHSFEILTIYYFNPYDGITVTDVISCLIILTGLFILIRTLYQEPLSRRTNE